MHLRAVLVVVFVLAAAATIVRGSAVAVLAERDPPMAAAFWTDHPVVLGAAAMAEVGGAAAVGQEPPAETMDRLDRLARKAPLAAEPYLVRGAIALRRGRADEAERLLLRARQLDPRGPAARFLLADLYLRGDMVLEGLAELSVLSRLVPGAIQQAAPALALYAANPDTAPELRRIIALYPELRPALLSQLAEDHRNANFILKIVDPNTLTDRDKAWIGRLLERLVDAGEFRPAYVAWARLSRISAAPSATFYNPTFRDNESLPPFNWALASSASGHAEPSSGGLRILYYGRDDAVLASQMTLLPPGRYRLRMRMSGRARPGIGWTVTCLPGDREVLQLSIERVAAGGILEAEFAVPVSSCGAQRVALRGRAAEFAESADLHISELKLMRIGG